MTDKQIWEKTEHGEYLDAKFYDRASGEIFIVELRKDAREEMEDFIASCQAVADENFDYPCFVELIGWHDATILGYDTY